MPRLPPSSVCVLCFVFLLLLLIFHALVPLPQPKASLLKYHTQESEKVANDLLFWLLCWNKFHYTFFFVFLLTFHSCFLSIYLFFLFWRSSVTNSIVYFACVPFVTNQFGQIGRWNGGVGGRFVSFPLNVVRGVLGVNRQWAGNRISDWIEIIYLVCAEHGV